MTKFLLTLSLMFSATAFAGPKTVSELKETSVRIMNLEMSSGGTGSIFRSFDNASHILTNKHVCHLIEQGGVVDYKGKQYLITHYKKFVDHDLCIVRVAVNLKQNLQIAEKIAKESSKTVVSGHPSLLPHIATVGHLSEKMEIELLAGVRPCTADEIKGDPMTCAFFGGYPIIAVLQAQLVSNLIQPGNSGSAVFNDDGEIVGVVFAGNGRGFSFGLIVPQIYVAYFLQTAHMVDFVKVGTPVDEGNVKGRIFNYEKCDEVIFSKASAKIKQVCKSSSRTLLWMK